MPFDFAQAEQKVNDRRFLWKSDWKLGDSVSKLKITVCSYFVIWVMINGQFSYEKSRVLVSWQLTLLNSHFTHWTSHSMFSYVNASFHHCVFFSINPLTAGVAYIRVYNFYQHIKYHILNMLKIVSILLHNPYLVVCRVEAVSIWLYTT